MAKLVLNDVTSGYASTTLVNANNAAIEAALENTLSRDGTGPNQMGAALDMNGNLILNQGNPVTMVGFNWEGPWVTGTTYQVGDVVETDGTSYIAIVEHTASALFATDSANWQTVAEASFPAQAGNANKFLQTDGTSATWEVPDASEISFTQSGTGAVARDVQAVLHESVSVKDFGAVGDGVADDTAAIRLALAAWQSAVVAGNSGIFGAGLYVGSGPKLHFPKGIYKVTDYLTPDTSQAINYAGITGEDAIIVAADGVTVFGGVGYNVKINGLIFRGGACAVSIKTNNIDTCKIDISGCEFHNQTTACIQSDATSNSTHLTIHDSKFYMTEAAGGLIGKFLTGDQINFHHNWVSCYSAVAFHNGAAFLNIQNCLGVPGGAMAADGGRWVDNYGELNIDNLRMGGEFGGADALVHNHRSMATAYPIIPVKVRIANCPAWTLGYVIKFYKLPNIVEFVGNFGMVDSDGFYFDTTLTQADFVNFQGYGRFITDNNFPSNFLNSIGTTGNQSTGEALFLIKLARDGVYSPPATDRLKETQIRGSGGFGGGWTTAGTASGAFVANDYGVTTSQVTATADGQYRSILLSTFLNPAVLTPNRIYTLVFQIERTTIVSPELSLTISIGSSSPHVVQLDNRRGVYSIPFVYLNDTGIASATYDTFSMSIYSMKTGDVVQIGRYILLEGLHNYTSEVLVLKGTAAPAGYTVGIGYDAGYYRGDLNYRTNVAAAGFIGDVCTTAGTPTGTWKTWGAVSA